MSKGKKKTEYFLNRTIFPMTGKDRDKPYGEAGDKIKIINDTGSVFIVEVESTLIRLPCNPGDVNTIVTIISV